MKPEEANFRFLNSIKGGRISEVTMLASFQSRSSSVNLPDILQYSPDQISTKLRSRTGYAFSSTVHINPPHILQKHFFISKGTLSVAHSQVGSSS